MWSNTGTSTIDHGRLTLGTHGPVTADEARKLAIDALADANRGADPALEKAEKRKEKTVSDLADRYLTDHAEIKKKPDSVRNDRQMIRDYVKPALGTLPINAVTRRDVVKLHHSLRDRPTLANRVLSLLSKMFALAEAWGLRPDGTNPVRHVEKNQEVKRKRYLSGDELARLGKVLSDAEEAKTELPSVILCLRLLLTTGCRLGEIQTLQWSHVDLTKGVLNLPDSKTGAKTVPLAGPAIDLLLSAIKIRGNPYVCPGAKSGGYIIGIPKAWRRIREAADLPDLRIHDLRHSFASVAAAAGLGLPVIGALLGHSQAQTTQRYSHLSMDPLKAASDEVARRITEAMSLEPKGRGKVIPIRRGKK